MVPAEFADDPDGYVALVTGEMLDACAPHARWIDVFCDRGAFGADQAREILAAGIARGLQPRIHANQFQPGDGIAVAVEVGAASADHCTFASDRDIDLLAGSGTVATLLPGPSSRRGRPTPMPGGCSRPKSRWRWRPTAMPDEHTTSMPFCIAVAVREMHLSPDEAVWAATAGGALALRRSDIGRIAPGARADLLSLNAPSHIHLAYRPGVDLVDRVWRSPRTPRVAT